ncbi:class I SAM-dependent methyltransferase [Planococcus salinarum]|uniref:class I SAM-dependent methyltransferase n=1 Tax=Planococcus salinarum TaxID=622695 RepID=UPI000E3E7F87|nr:class I SAM-dependent methyltransferase [Planococcus salinarum]TAA70494.1 class I SAM-dependent methyltransferase [Planococcus salinarum]
MENLFGNVAQDFVNYRKGYPSKFYEKLQEECGVVFRNQQVLDIATSNGLAARDLAALGSYVTGVDNSPELIEEAIRTNRVEELNIKYFLGDVTDLPVEEKSFDLITAIHCWNVLPTEQTISEIYRVLKPGGKFILAQFDPVSIKNSVVTETEKIVSRFNTEWSRKSTHGIYPQWINDCYDGGFRNVETFSFDDLIPFSHEEWKGKMRTDESIGGSLQDEEVKAFDHALSILLEEQFDENVLDVPHRMFSVICEK